MNVRGLVGVPEPATDSAVVPSVSVNVPVEVTLTSFPFRSVPEPAPTGALYGAFTFVPRAL